MESVQEAVASTSVSTALSVKVRSFWRIDKGDIITLAVIFFSPFFPLINTFITQRREKEGQRAADLALETSGALFHICSEDERKPLFAALHISSASEEEKLGK